MTDYTTTTILADIRKLIGASSASAATVNNSGQLLSNEALARFLNLEQTGNILPFIMREQEEYLIAYVDQTVTQNVSRYPMPSNAIGPKLKAVHQLSSTNDETYELKRTSLSAVGNIGALALYSFYIEGNYWVLAPTPSQTETMRVYFYKRPNAIVTPGEGAVIASVNSMSNTFDLVGNVPSGWAAGTVIDVVRATPPFETIATLTISNIVSTTVTVPSVTGIVAGDTVALTGNTIVPQILPELFPVLTYGAAVKALKAKKDFDGAKLLNEEYKVLRDNIFSVISPRVDDTPQSITSVGNIADYVSGIWR